MLEIVSVAAPLLVTVTVWGALTVFTNWVPKPTLVTESANGSGAESRTRQGYNLAAGRCSGIVVGHGQCAIEVSGCGGRKVTLMVQFAPAARLAVQLLVVPKLAEVETPTIINGALPVLVSITGCGGTGGAHRLGSGKRHGGG